MKRKESESESESECQRKKNVQVSSMRVFSYITNTHTLKSI